MRLERGYTFACDPIRVQTREHTRAHTCGESEGLKVNVMKVGGEKGKKEARIEFTSADGLLADSNLCEQSSSKYITGFSGR